MTSRNFLGSHQIFCVNKCRTFPKNTMSLCKSQHILQLFCKKNIIIGFHFQKRNAKQLQCSNCSLVICGFALVFVIDFILVFRTSLQFTDSNLPTGKLKDRITINTGCCLGMLIIGYIRHWTDIGRHLASPIYK